MKRTYEFYIETRYVGSRVTEKVELQFPDDATEEEIEDDVYEVWIKWKDENCVGGWIHV
ncbi:hypothetical protein KKH23_09265 [Patescibacteria group bacterium]|nr:hypothetical protein [Patescibacteria group bacterium]